MNIAEKLTKIAENEPLVYEAGKTDGVDAYRKDFWSSFLWDGAPPDAQYMFAGRGWSDETFRPVYGIKGFWSASHMFDSSWIQNLKSILEESGVTFNFSSCENFSYAFAYSKIKEIGVISAVKGTNFSYTFYYCGSLESVDRIDLKGDGSQTFLDTFMYCTALKDITFTGVIGNSISFRSSSLLSKASIENIVSVLSASASGKTLTLSLTAKQNAFSDSEWAALIGTKPNWNFSLL